MFWQIFLKFPACHWVQVWKDTAQHRWGAVIRRGGGSHGKESSWQISGDEGRKEVKDVRGEWEEDSPPPRGIFFFEGGLFISSSSASFCSSLLSSLPRDRNPGPRNQQHRPLRLKPLWLQNLLWGSCSPFHLCLYSLFLTINYKTRGREVEDKLVCQPRVALPSPLVSELVSLLGKRRWKSEWLAVLTLRWSSVWFIGEDLPF